MAERSLVRVGADRTRATHRASRCPSSPLSAYAERGTGGEESRRRLYNTRRLTTRRRRTVRPEWPRHIASARPRAHQVLRACGAQDDRLARSRKEEQSTHRLTGG